MKTLTRNKQVSPELFGANSINVLNKLSQNRNVFAKSLERTIDDTIRENLSNSILNGAWEEIDTLIYTAFGADVYDRLMVKPGQMSGTYKVKGYVINGEKSRFELVEGIGIRANSAYNALSLIMIAFGLVSSTRAEELGANPDLGLWVRPSNSLGETLTSQSKLFVGELDLPYSTNCYRYRAIELANLLGNAKVTKASKTVGLETLLDCKSNEIQSKVKHLIKGVSADEVLYSLSMYLLAEKNSAVSYLVPNSASIIYELLKVEVPSNIYFLADQGVVYFDYFHSDIDSLLISHLMQYASKCGKKNFVTIFENEDSHDIFFEEEYVVISGEGVYDARGRRFMNVLVTDSRALSVQAGSEDLILINSHGSYVMTLLNSLWYLDEIRKGNNSVEPIARWYKFFTDLVPMDSEAESGALSVGQRGDYMRVATQAYTWKGLLPFTFGVGGLTMKGLGESHDNKITVKGKAKTEGQLAKFKGLKHQLSKAALESYNLVQVHKGNIAFMDASWATLRGKDIPQEIAKEFITTIVNKIYGKSLSEGLWELYFKDVEDKNILRLAKTLLDKEDLLLELFLKHGHLPLSTKVAKITKRITLAMPSSAEPINGAIRAFSRIGSVAGLDVGHRYTAGVFPHVLNAPGVIWQLCELLKPFIVKQNFEETIEAYDLDHSKWEFYKIGVYDKKGHKHSMTFRHMLTNNYTGEETEKELIENSGLFVTKNSVIVEIPYTTNTGEICYYTMVADEDGWVKDVTWWELEIGGEKLLTVRITWDDVQRNAKLRQTFKALVSRPSSALWSCKTKPELIYNDLNVELDKLLGKKLPNAIEIITTGDSDKSKDLLSGLLDIATETEAGNSRTSSISKLNSIVGINRGDVLLYHEIFALSGKYDAFMNTWMKRYGRPVWFHNRDAGEAMLTAVREMYGNKSETDNPKAKWIKRSLEWLKENCPETANYNFEGNKHLVVTSNMNNDATFTQYDEVFVFGVDNFATKEGLILPEFFWQRSYGFIGNGNDDHVYINAKVELSSVDQSVSTSPLMSAVARCVDIGVGSVTGDHKTALSLTEASTKRSTDQFKALHGMLNNYPLADQDGDLCQVNLFGDNGLISPEALEIISHIDGFKERASEGDKTLLVDIAEVSRDVCFYISKDRYLYLPAVIKQSRSTEDRQSFSGSVATLFLYAINGAKGEAIQSRIRRINGALEKLCESKNLSKAMFMGRKSSQTKVLGVFGIPLTYYVTIIGSKAFWEVVDSCVDEGIISERSEWRKLIGMRLLISRAPLPFPACLIFFPVNYGHPYASLINESQAGVNPLIAYCSAGDYDGDQYPVTPLDLDSDYPLVTYKVVMETTRERIGEDPIGYGASAYIADHYVPKGWKQNQVINPTLLQKGNIGLYDAIPNFNEDSVLGFGSDSYDPNADTCPAFEKYSFISTMSASTEMQSVLVGATHKIAVFGEIAVGIANLCHDLLVEHFGEQFHIEYCSSFLSAPILLALYELYEGGTLGGLSWEAYSAIKLLYVATTKQVNAICIDGNNIGGDGSQEYIKALKAASINTGDTNHNYARHYLEVADTLRQVQELTTQKELELEVSEDQDGKFFFRFHNEEFNLSSGSLNGSNYCHYISYLLYTLCGGKFDPKVKTDGDEKVIKLNGHAALALLVYYIPRTLWDKMKAVSVAIANLDLFLEEALPIFAPTLCADLGEHEFVVVNGIAKPVLTINLDSF
jgi:hypothetical protein